MGNNAKGFEFKKFATPRIVGGIAIAVIVLWALSIIFGSSKGPSSKNMAEKPHDSVMATDASQSAHQAGSTETAHPSAAAPTDQGDQTGTAGSHETTSADKATTHGMTAAKATDGSHGTKTADETTTHGVTAAKATAGSHETKTADETTTHGMTAAKATAGSHGTATSQEPAAHGPSAKTAGSAPAQQPATHPQPVAATDHNVQASDQGTAGQATAQHGAASGHPMPASVVGAPVHKPTPKGVAFVEATIKPLEFELEERWWGWRPNDIIDLTDNVNNFQMGVLEVTRRTTVALAERISRTGTTDAFDENLEQAMNWFMIKPSSFWFPSAESKYRDGLEELQAYLEKLREGNATFYTRTDNLIPLLASFVDLLGSCDENLVKQVNEDGTPVGSFAVDNYFFYTQGVASSMATVLEAVHHDFLLTLESRHATELLHHAIVSCQQAAEIDPWIILNRDFSSVFANHRANMAAPISHAYFYIGQLIKTLST